MEDVAGRIELYHNLFRGCLILAIMCFVLAVVLFFVLDIRSVLGYLTGRQKKKVVRAMEAENAASGRLLRERSARHAAAPTVQEELGVRQNAAPGARKVENVVEYAAAGREQNSSEQDKKLQENHEEAKNADSDTVLLEDTADSSGRFFIEREVVLIHAEEII